MKLLNQILLILVAVIGFSLTASAQQQPEEKKRPPKQNVEIKPEEKNKPREEKPKNENRNNDNRNKKPQMFFLISENRIEVTSV
jgi:hypothetical protein